DSAWKIASITACTVAIRALHAAGGVGLTRVPGGSVKLSGRKHPSFIAMAGSRKHRSANITPDNACENAALIAPRAWRSVPVKSKWQSEPFTVTATRTV